MNDRLAYWLTDWLTCLLADWLTNWLACWLTEWLTGQHTDWLANWLMTEWLSDWVTEWLADRLTDWLTILHTEWLGDWCLDRWSFWGNHGQISWLLLTWISGRLAFWLFKSSRVSSHWFLTYWLMMKWLAKWLTVQTYQRLNDWWGPV